VVARLEPAGDDDVSTLPPALTAGLGPYPIALALRLDGPGQVKPEEALRAVFGADFRLPPVDLVRTGFWRLEDEEPRPPLEASRRSEAVGATGS
jgi:hypothetical protein